MSEAGVIGGCDVLFHQDGAFADTVRDMGYALNRVLEARGRPPAGHPGLAGR